MTEFEIDQCLSSVMRQRSEPLNSPSDADWHHLQELFECEFDPDFKQFMSGVAKYYFPGELFVVGSENNGNGRIEEVYKCEMAMLGWRSQMIPFYAIGNGDYFCLDAKRSPVSPIFYFYHDRLAFEEHSPTMAAWICQLPEFFGSG